MIQTAEEFLKEKLKEHYNYIKGEYSLNQMNTLNAEKVMIWIQEYSLLKAKFYVREALKEAYLKVKVLGDYGDYKETIESSYNLDNIK